VRNTDTARQLYRPDPVPSDPKALQGYLSREFDRIANIVNADVKLETLHAEPAKPRDGLIVKADGTDWNPGSGEGAYCYYAAAWNFLG
jgi:hypothetical protein